MVKEWLHVPFLHAVFAKPQNKVCLSDLLSKISLLLRQGAIMKNMVCQNGALGHLCILYFYESRCSLYYSTSLK